MKVAPYAKSVVSAFAAGVAVLSTAILDDNISSGEGVAIALAVLGALGITYAVPNKTR